jgi:PAS domain S-box-containing protein
MLFFSFHHFLLTFHIQLMIMMYSQKRKDFGLFFIAFLVGALMIILGVNYYFTTEKAKIRKAKNEELESIASLKIRQISYWYTDELSDAATIVGDKYFSKLAHSWSSTHFPTVESELVDLLTQLANEHGYKSVIILYGDFLNQIASGKEYSHVSEVTLLTAQKVIKTGLTSSTDIFLCPQDSDIFIDFITPLNLNTAIPAVVVFRHEPSGFLYPLLENWPVPSKTAETLLLRKEKENVLFLNNVRHIRNSALRLSIPLSKEEVPAVKATLGEKGFVDGIDYRGKKVYAYIDSVPKTPWFMVAKVDQSELYSNFFFNATMPIIFSFAGIILLLMVFYIFYTRQQKNLYKRLYNTQQEYKTILYSIGDAVITTSKEALIIALNPVAEKLTGWSEEEANGKPIDEVFKIIQEETRETVVNPVKRVLKEGVIVGLANHTLLITKQGDEIPISDSGAPIFDRNGNITGVVLVFRDQTEEHNKQRALLDAQRKMSTLLSNLPGMAYRCFDDPDWTMEFISKGCEGLTGYSAWELEGNQIVSYGNIIFPEDRGYVWDKVEEALDKKEPFQLEYRIVTKQGNVIWVWERGRGIFNDEGHLEAIEGFITDISERKQVEEKLLITEEIFSHFMEYSPIYVFFKDDNIRSLRLSKNFEQMLGRPLDELLGKNMFELFPSDLARQMVDDDIDVLTKGETVTIEENFAGRNYLTIKFPVTIDGKNSYLAGFTMDITESKQTEKALKASEMLFQTLAENAAVGIFRTDAQGLTTYVNSAWCELVGVDKEEALEEGWMRFIHPDDHDGLIESWKKANSLGTISEAEYRFLHANGEIIWVKGKAVPEFNDKGDLQGYIGTISDITEIKTSTEAIHRANILLRTIIDNIPDAIYMKDIEGRKLIANKADVANMGAISEADVIGKTDFNFFTEEVASKLWEDDLQVLNLGIPFIQREEKLVNFQGEEKWLVTSKIPFRDKKEKIIGLVGIGHDITLRKRREEEMLKLTKAVTQSPVSIVITNLKGEIEYVNPKFTEVTGYTFEEAIGNNPRILKSGFQSLDVYQDLWTTILSGNDWKGELQNRKKNGELYWESVIISPIVNDSGEIVYFVAVKEDITEKKSMVSELIEAKLKAEESDRLKSAFLANMSHEIRTPLNSILGFSNFLTGDDILSKEEKEEYSNIINKSADSLLQIINDIIDISSLETGQLKTSLKPVEVNEILRSLYLVFSRKLVEINKSHLILELVISEEITVFADENRFIQIITNMVNNAMKFTVRGTIRFGVESHDDKNAVFFVSDTGIGISPEMHDSIFERFRQVENDKSRNFGGNGLGLAIVKNLVELMGGKISIESEVDKGSIFRFTLPKV